MPKLEAIRKGKLLTRQDLAEKADISLSTIYLIEAGRTTPRFTIIKKLCNALTVEPGDVEEFQAALEVADKGTRRKGEKC